MKLWFVRGAWASRKGHKVAESIKPDDVRSVAVIRHAALGDMVITRPFLIELRRFFPNASVTLSTVSHYQVGVPEDLVDDVHITYGGKDGKSFLEQVRRGRELGDHDLIFDLTGSSRSYWLCMLNKAKLKLGFPYRQIQNRIFYDVGVPRSDLRFEAETMLDLLQVLGCKVEYPLRFDLPGDAYKTDRPYIVYFPTASAPSKCWERTRYIELIRSAAEAYPDYDHVIMEGVQDWESADDMQEKLVEFVNVKVHKPMPMDELSSFIKGAVLMVSNDTGIRNLAICCETPTIGIFVETLPFAYWPRYGLHDVIFNLDCSMPAVDSVYDAMSTILGKIEA